MKEYVFCPICGAALQTGMIEGKERRHCPGCTFVDYRNPLPVVLAIAVKDKDFLLIKRGLPPKKGTWASPAGFIEIGETAEEACLRELKEETGVSGEIVRLVKVTRREDKEVYGDMLIVEYLVKLVNDELNTAGDVEVEDVKFFSVDELPDYYISCFRDVVEEVRKGI